MPGFLYHVGATAMCPHTGQISVVSSNTRVLVNSMPVATLADFYAIGGCPFQIPLGVGTKPQPCVKVQWLVPATRVLINGQPAILQSSGGMCQSIEQIPQGAPSVVATQTRVVGT